MYAVNADQHTPRLEYVNLHSLTIDKMLIGLICGLTEKSCMRHAHAHPHWLHDTPIDSVDQHVDYIADTPLQRIIWSQSCYRVPKVGITWPPWLL